MRDTGEVAVRLWKAEVLILAMKHGVETGQLVICIKRHVPGPRLVPKLGMCIEKRINVRFRDD